MLKFRDVTLRRGGRVLFAAANFAVFPGQKVGITGANGTGKSSLFALLRGELHADAGDVDVPAKWIFGHVAQETPAVDQPAIEYVLDGDTELRAIERDIRAAEHAEDGVRLATLHGEYDHQGGYTANSRAAQLLYGLGFSAAQHASAVREFSGGWRMRLNLARALMRRSDVLLLDEPTNHLDLDAVLWLEDYLRAYPGALLLISHDREFLDRVVDAVVHIEHETLTLYTGNYSSFEQQRAAQRAGQQADFARQQREIAHIRSYIDRFKTHASKARQAQSRMKALERMELIAPAHVDTPFRFAFRDPQKIPNPLVTLEHVERRRIPQRPVFGDANLQLVPGDRVGLARPQRRGQVDVDQSARGNRRACRAANGSRRKTCASATSRSISWSSWMLRRARCSTCSASIRARGSRTCGIFSAASAFPATRCWAPWSRFPAARRRAWCLRYSFINGRTCCCSTSRPIIWISRCGTR